MSKFDPSEFRQALATFATGVTVVTAASDEGKLAGVTANSFTSVSLDPPLILWCLASTSDSLEIFQHANHFAVNILASDQKAISAHFARRMEDKFKLFPYTTGLGGAPLLQNCMSTLQCRSREQYEVGDHWVFVGEVMAFESSSREALLFHLGSYGISLPLPMDESSVIGSPARPEIHDDSLFSLLLQAIHAYQERFESRQKQIFESSYQARVMTILHKYHKLDINEICQMVQMPKTDAMSVLRELKHKDLIDFNPEEEQGHVTLQEKGRLRADELVSLAKQHDRDVYALFRKCDASAFRDNLIRIINWTDKT